MKNSTLGIAAVVIVVVGGGGGCIVHQYLQTPSASSEKQAPPRAPATKPEPTPAPLPPAAIEPSPAPTTPEPSAREGKTPPISEIVVTKQTDSASSVTPPAPAPSPSPSPVSTSTAPPTPSPSPVSGSTGAMTESSKPPSAVSPPNGTEFAAADALNPMTFRWTPVVPKPQEPITYRLKVWQLMQGQNGTAAMKSNQPIATKDVDNLTEATVSGIYTGPCKPPYLCDFVWSVSSMAGGMSAGASEPATFSVAAEAAASGSASGGAAGTP